MNRLDRSPGGRWLPFVLVAVGLAGLPVVAPAQAPGIDPQAQAILKKATDYLAGLKQFSVDTRSTIEVVLESGQKLQFDHGASASVQRPNRLVARRKGDLVNQVFYYDGKHLTLYNPDQKYYATVAAPDTLEAMLDYARESLDVIVPAGDLLYRNAFEILMADVVAGFVVGKGVVAGVRCDHLAFRNADVDWQIWVQEGDRPLPRKFVITSTQVAGAPQFAVVMTNWNTAPKLAEGMFAIAPPKDAKKIDFLRLTAGTAPAQAPSTGGKR
ncbi:MAG TPA: DUF2092 domain-containing protein [Burkholderiales bacterium]|nr:DUF2092 domain-containing protein [Burkholderiales bacterium]